MIFQAITKKICAGACLAPDYHIILHAWSQLRLPATVWDMSHDYLFAHWIGDWTQAKHLIRFERFIVYSFVMLLPWKKNFIIKSSKGKHTQKRLPEVDQPGDLHSCWETAGALNEDELCKPTNDGNPPLDSSTRTVTFCLLCREQLIGACIPNRMKPASLNSHTPFGWTMCGL